MAEAVKQQAAAPSFVDTPEFKAAVAEAARIAAASAVQQALTEITAKAATKATATPGPGDVSQTVMEQLAMAIAEISDQGTARKRVAPEILAARAEAHREAVALLVKAREEGLKPQYRLISKVYLNERFIEPYQMGKDKRPEPTEITWGGMPSDAMRPINDIAERIYDRYRASVGTPGRIQGVQEKPLWMTPGGVVVKGDAPARRVVAAVEQAFTDELAVGGAHDPTAPFIHVLGTVAQPARQNVSG